MAGCKVIFLTGYTDFEYAYQAVRNEAAGYILKTEDDDVIVDTVLKAVRMLEESERAEQWLQQAEEQLVHAIPLLRNDYLAGLVRGEHSSVESRVLQFQELGIALDPSRMVTIIMAREDQRQSANFADVSYESLTRSAKDKSVWPHAIASISEALLARSARCVHLSVDGQLCWLVQSDFMILAEPARGAASSAVVIMEALDRVQAYMREKLGLHLSFVISDMSIQWEELGERQEEMKHGLLVLKVSRAVL